MSKYYTEDQIDFIKNNYPEKGGIICAEYCNKSRQAVSTYARRFLGLNALRKYFVDLNQFLDITTPEIAYYLGLLWADGTVRKIGNHVSISLVRKDMENIEWIFDRIGKFHKYIKKSRHGWQEAFVISVSCQNLNSFLKECDYDKKSGASPDKILEKIPENLRHYWWRGYCDGDGSIAVDKNGRYRVSLASCFDQDWSFVEKLFSDLEIFGIHQTVDIINKKTGNPNRSSTYLVANKAGVIKFLEYIYQNRNNDKIGLNRKYEKYLLAIQQIQKFEDNKNRPTVKCPIIISKDGNFVNKFESIKKASEYLNVRYSLLIDHLRREDDKTVNGFIVKRESLTSK